MLGLELLHKTLEKSCVDIHRTRLKALFAATEGLVRSKTASLTSIGRHLMSKTTTKHDIKRIDRLLGNPNLIEDKISLMKSLVKKILSPKISFLMIIVDESVLDSQNTKKLLRFSLALSGRPLTIYEKVYTNGSFANHAEDILEELKTCIDSGCEVVVISDAGFFPKWFKRIEEIGWHWLGRLSLDYCYKLQNEDIWHKTRGLYKSATNKPKQFSSILLTKEHGLACQLTLYRNNKKGRFNKNKLGARDKRKTALEKTKSANEPWLLATSLPSSRFKAKVIVKLYALRMQIEEAFRDLKSERYGVSFNSSLSKSILRLNNLILITTLVHFASWIIGRYAENQQLHRQFQANTIKTRRVLSYVYLGLQILRTPKQHIKRTGLRLYFNNKLQEDIYNIIEANYA